MPTNTTITTNYAGEDAGKIVGQAYKETETLSKGLVTFMPNIKHTAVLKKIQYTNGKTDYSCGFTPAGAVVLTEKELTPKVIKNDLQVCKDTFANYWDGEGEIMEAVEENVWESTATALDAEIWVGDSSVAGQISGFILQFEADADVIDVTGPAITTANVVAELQKVKSAIPVALRGKKDMKIVVSPDVADVYESYLIAQGLVNGLGGEGSALKYGRYSLEQVSGLPSNTVIAYQKENLVVGHRGKDAQNQFQLADEDEIGLMTGNIRGKQVYTGGTGYYNGSEIVYRTNA